jgi:hypothetical protein
VNKLCRVTALRVRFRESGAWRYEAHLLCAGNGQVLKGEVKGQEALWDTLRQGQIAAEKEAFGTSLTEAARSV